MNPTKRNLTSKKVYYAWPEKQASVLGKKLFSGGANFKLIKTVGFSNLDFLTFYA